MKWSKEDDNYLIEQWGVVSIPTIAKNLNRTEYSILNRKNRLGLPAFLDNGDYLTVNHLFHCLGKDSCSYTRNLWIQEYGFPVRHQRVNQCRFKIVKIEEFWEWAEKNRTLINWSTFEKNSLGEEPAWTKECRKHAEKKRRTSKWTKEEDALLKTLVSLHKFTWRELTERLNRSDGAIQRRLTKLGMKARPLRVEPHAGKWTEKEIEILEKMLLNRTPYLLMIEKLEKSEKAIRGYIYRAYGSENIEKAAREIERRMKDGRTNQASGAR